MTEPNPWLMDPRDEPDAETILAEPALAWEPPNVEITVTAGNQVGPPVPPGQLAVTGAHGGAGATTWACLLDGTDTRTLWPGPNPEPTRTLIVARANRRGLAAARDAGLQWAAKQLPHIHLIGLLLAPDIPGRLPKELQDDHERVTAIFPRVFSAPYQRDWREQLPEAVVPGKQIQNLIDQIVGGSK